MICFKSVRLYMCKEYYKNIDIYIYCNIVYLHVKIQGGMYNHFVRDMILYKNETEEEI